MNLRATGLLALADELLLDIAEHLKTTDLSALTKTCHQLHAKLIDSLYKHDASTSRYRALTWAARHGNIETAEPSVEAGADVNAVFRPEGRGKLPRILTYDDDNVEATALQIAIAYGRDDAAAWLVEHGAKIDDMLYPDAFRFPLLHLAGAMGLINTTKALLDKGAEANATDIFKYTALHHAVDPSFCGRAVGSSQAVALLLERIANIFALDTRDFTPVELSHRTSKGEFFCPRMTESLPLLEAQPVGPPDRVEEVEAWRELEKIRELLQEKMGDENWQTVGNCHAKCSKRSVGGRERRPAVQPSKPPRSRCEYPRWYCRQRTD